MPQVNGSFVTSQLPQSLNVVSTDRILIVYNAIANTSVGSGNASTRTITVNNFVNSLALANSAFIDTTNANNITKGTLPSSIIPNPTYTTLGGVQAFAPLGNQFVTGISESGVVSTATQNENIFYSTNNVVFTGDFRTYAVALTDTYIFCNTNSQGDVSVVLPSAASPGKYYFIKKTSATSDIVSLTTDNLLICLIDGADFQFTNAIYGSFGVVMGPDGNYWMTQQGLNYVSY